MSRAASFFLLIVGSYRDFWGLIFSQFYATVAVSCEFSGEVGIGLQWPLYLSPDLVKLDKGHTLNKEKPAPCEDRLAGFSTAKRAA
jgi:hypothetical protein